MHYNYNYNYNYQKWHQESYYIASSVSVESWDHWRCHVTRDRVWSDHDALRSSHMWVVVWSWHSFYVFNNQTETIAMLLAELRRLTEHCEFGAPLDEMLRDRLMCGVHVIWLLQRRLLAEPKSTLKRALDLALALNRSHRQRCFGNT